MKRSTFLQQFNLALLGVTAFPFLAFKQNELNIQELIGKESPKLFGKNYKLRLEAHQAYLKMQEAALKDNITIQIFSSYRSFTHQKNIWERKYKKYEKQGLAPEKIIKKIVEYSTIPGTSRHHWGTDIDIIDAAVTQPKRVLQEQNFHNNGAFCKLKEWLDDNATKFNFYLVYTDNGNRKGFKYEPWHYSYKPLSKKYLQQYKKLSITKILQQEALLGSTYFSTTFMENYLQENILDINPELL